MKEANRNLLQATQALRKTSMNAHGKTLATYYRDVPPPVHPQLDLGPPPKTIWEHTVEGNLSFINEYAAEGKTFEAVSSDGWTPLHLATMNNKLRCMEVLINHGANIESKRAKYLCETPLILACRLGLTTALQLLIFHGASPNSLDVNGMSGLMHGAQEGHMAICTALLSCGGTSMSKKCKEGRMKGRSAEEIALFKARVSKGCDAFSLYNSIRLYIMKMRDQSAAKRDLAKISKEAFCRRRLSQVGLRHNAQKLAQLPIGLPHENLTLNDALGGRNTARISQVRVSDLVNAGVSHGQADRALKMWKRRVL